jgi:hypothetical protein
MCPPTIRLPHHQPKLLLFPPSSFASCFFFFRIGLFNPQFQQRFQSEKINNLPHLIAHRITRTQWQTCPSSERATAALLSSKCATEKQRSRAHGVLVSSPWRGGGRGVEEHQTDGRCFFKDWNCHVRLLGFIRCVPPRKPPSARPGPRRMYPMFRLFPQRTQISFRRGPSLPPPEIYMWQRRLC